MPTKTHVTQFAALIDGRGNFSIYRDIDGKFGVDPYRSGGWRQVSFDDSTAELHIVTTDGDSLDALRHVAEVAAERGGMMEIAKSYLRRTQGCLTCPHCGRRVVAKWQFRGHLFMEHQDVPGGLMMG